ncbi:hypothetical protein HZ994_17995 [Akkermansiaceae bacterium]|nr:hypothetical protein HZ994_17995 [Akkermansiaceae bacterium]
MEETRNSFELVESRDAIELVPRWEAQAWWFFAGGGLILAVVLTVVVLRRKKSVADPHRERREAYREAKEDFREAQGGGVRDAAIRVSVILRRYLARSLGEPSLYETHEEFISRHDALNSLPGDVRDEAAQFFGRLAALKYAPVPPDAEPAAIRDGGLELLERMHAA